MNMLEDPKCPLYTEANLRACALNVQSIISPSALHIVAQQKAAEGNGHFVMCEGQSGQQKGLSTYLIGARKTTKLMIS